MNDITLSPALSPEWIFLSFLTNSFIFTSQNLRMSFIFCIFALKFVLSHLIGCKASKNRACIVVVLGDYCVIIA